MSIDTKHPTLTPAREAEFDLMRAASNGESAIKDKGELYLPKPSGFDGASDGGVAMYAAYQLRAQFPEFLAPSISAMVGIVHAKEIAIEIPDSMAYVLEDATSDGLTLEAFHRRITRALLTYGRFGVLVDAPESGGEPYLCGYSGASIINWDTDFFVIDVSGMVRDGFEWKPVKRHLVLRFDKAGYTQATVTDSAEVKATPTGTGGKKLDRIPFVVSSALDISPDLHTPPLIGVSRAALAIYQLSGDYRWQLFMSGQETLVAINGEGPSVVGAGVVHVMQGADGQAPELKYVSPSCSGIDAHRTAIDDNRATAIMAGARLLQEESKSQESGKARSLRFASETATLSSIAQLSCAVLEKSLRNIAMMKGIPEDEITVTPPSDLLDTTLTPEQIKVLVASWQSGAFGYETLYENLQRGGIANPDRTADEELLLADGPEESQQDVADAAA